MTMIAKLNQRALGFFSYIAGGCFKTASCVDIEWCMRNLKRKGFYPKAIVDIGAYVGMWTIQINKIFPDSYILMIEAQPDKEACLKKVKDKFPSSVDYIINLVGSRNQDAMEFFQMGTGSSVLEEQSNVPR